MSGHTPWSQIKHKAHSGWAAAYRVAYEEEMQRREDEHRKEVETEEARRRLIAEVLANRDRVGPDAVLRKTKLPGDEL